jgi:hypothetical protein
VKAVEERTVVEPGRGVQVTLVLQPLELGDVARNQIEVEPEVVARGDDGLLAQGAAEEVERVGEEAAAAVGVGLGPEKGEELVAAQGPPAGEEREQGELTAARGPAGYGRARPLHRGATQELERQHVAIRERNTSAPREGREGEARH